MYFYIRVRIAYTNALPVPLPNLYTCAFDRESSERCACHQLRPPVQAHPPGNMMYIIVRLVTVVLQ